MSIPGKNCLENWICEKLFGLSLPSCSKVTLFVYLCNTYSLGVSPYKEKRVEGNNSPK